VGIYEYDDHMKKLIYQFKGCRDYELKDAFVAPFKKELKMRFRDFFLVRLPSYEGDDIERGFNHVEEIFKCLKLPFINCLYKTKKYKQSARNFEERQEISKVIVIKNGEKLMGKKILIVDDISTTGASLKTAVNLIRQFNPKEMKILVVAKRVL